MGGSHTPHSSMKGARLGMKPLHQSLLNLMPHGVWGDSLEILKSLLFQKLSISLMGP